MGTETERSRGTTDVGTRRDRPSGVDEFDSLVVAAQRMRSQGIGTIPVRGVGNRFVGMLSDRDIIGPLE